MSSRPIISLRLPKPIKDALVRSGYETARDILSAEPKSIARDLNIAVEEVEGILQQIKKPATQQPSMPLTQSVATMISTQTKFSTRWPPLDKLLEGGLVRGHVLEVAGSPGTPKETIAIDIAVSFLEAGEVVLFVDCQNMVPLSRLRHRLPASILCSLHYTQIQGAAEIMVFLNSLSKILESMPKVTLLVLNSLSFPFSNFPNPRTKPGILEHVKQIFTKAAVAKNLTIVVTSQLATKVLKDDGSPGNFEEGGRVMMVPQLGSSYLPPERSHRILLSLNSPVSGLMYLLPSSSEGTSNKPVPHEPYVVQ